MNTRVHITQTDQIVETAAAMLRQGKNNEAINYLTSQEALSLRARDYLCDAYFQNRDWKNAHKTVRGLIDSGAATLTNLRLEAKILSNWGRYKDALSCIKTYVSDCGEDVQSMVIAKVCSYNLGDYAEAQRFGQQALILKDQASTSSTKVFPIRPSKGVRRIISYSVWGENKVYLLGAAVNIVLAKRYLPDWLVRIYTSSATDPAFLEMYAKLGAEVIFADQKFPEIPTYFWRFLVADDADTGYFLCRDADCRIGAQEAQLVNEWIVSKKRFHVARDHLLHDDLILAGMWGGVGSADLKIQELISTYFDGKPTNKYGHDQIFLGKMVWPLIRQSVLVHDRYYWTPGIKSHKHKLTFNFGEGFTHEASVIAEASDMGLICQS